MEGALCSQEAALDLQPELRASPSEAIGAASIANAWIHHRHLCAGWLEVIRHGSLLLILHSVGLAR